MRDTKSMTEKMTVPFGELEVGRFFRMNDEWIRAGGGSDAAYVWRKVETTFVGRDLFYNADKFERTDLSAPIMATRFWLDIEVVPLGKEVEEIYERSRTGI